MDYNLDQIDDIKDEVLRRVRQLDQPYLNQYEGAVTSWLVNTVLECAQQGNSADGNGACPGGIYHIEYLDAEIVRLIPRP